MERLEQEGRKDIDQLGRWADRMEAQMRPAIDRFEKRVGGLVETVIDRLGESPLFEHADVDRRDNVAVVVEDKGGEKEEAAAAAAAGGQLSLPHRYTCKYSMQASIV